MTELTLINGGFRIKLQEVCLENIEEIPSIDEILEEYGKISSGEVPHWYSIFGECTSCPLARKTFHGKNYREKVMQEILNKTLDNFVLFELEPGHMLLDLEWIDRINSIEREDPIRKVTLIHYSPSKDYCKILRENMKENPMYISFEIDKDRKYTERELWAWMESVRRGFLLHYAHLKNIELDIIVIDSIEEFFQNNIHVDLCLAVDYFDQHFSHVLDCHKMFALLGTRQPQLNVLSCITNGMFHPEPNIYYKKYQITCPTALTYMKSYGEQKRIIQDRETEQKPYYEIIQMEKPYIMENFRKMFAQKGFFQSIGSECYYYLDEEKYKEIQKVIQKLERDLEIFQLSFFEDSGELVYKEIININKGTLLT